MQLLQLGNYIYLEKPLCLYNKKSGFYYTYYLTSIRLFVLQILMFLHKLRDFQNYLGQYILCN